MTAYITMFAVAMALLLPIYLLVRRRMNRRRPAPGGRGREVLLALFVLFCGAMAMLLFDGFYPWHWLPGSIGRVVANRLQTGVDINLVPFKVIRRYLELMDMSGGNLNIFAVNLIGNVLMFVPFGFFLPLLWRRWQAWWKMLLFALLFPVGVETVQLLLPRSVDIDDVLLNALGILLGWGICRLTQCLAPKTKALAAPKRDRAARRGGKPGAQRDT